VPSTDKSAKREVRKIEIVEIDDRWHFTVKKRKLWLRIASDRLDQQVIAYTVGVGSRKAWNRLLD
jgi:IS1 family transposase